jgi:histidinol dehydrogenase
MRPANAMRPVLYVAASCGIEQVLKLGGRTGDCGNGIWHRVGPEVRQAVRSGNAWVTDAKRLVAADIDGAAIDLPAGPSEVLVIADARANPDAVAADLLAQAEHGPDSQVVLIADDRALLEASVRALNQQLEELPRRQIASAVARACARDPRSLPRRSRRHQQRLRAGAPHPQRRCTAALAREGRKRRIGVLGPWSPESVGDYCSGTNHVLPTYGHARAWSGVSVASFLKQIHRAGIDRVKGLRGIGPCAATLARSRGDARA